MTVTSMIKGISYDVEVLAGSDTDSECLICRLCGRSLALEGIFILLAYIYLV